MKKTVQVRKWQIIMVAALLLLVPVVTFFVGLNEGKQNSDPLLISYADLNERAAKTVPTSPEPQPSSAASPSMQAGAIDLSGKTDPQTLQTSQDRTIPDNDMQPETPGEGDTTDDRQTPSETEQPVESRTEQTTTKSTGSSKDPAPETVWISTKGGTKYHRTATCSGMKSAIEVTLEYAEENGYTPCKKCFK